MKLSELILAVGDENVGIQNLDHCATSLDYSAKRGTKITFRTDQTITPNGTDRLGMVVWLPRDKVADAMRAAEIDARFTEREKTVRMGRDPASEAEAMRDDAPSPGDVVYVGRVNVAEGVADVVMNRFRVAKLLGPGRHRIYSVKPDPAFPTDPQLMAHGRLHHAEETTPEALLSRVEDIWDTAGFNAETSDFLRDIGEHLRAIVSKEATE